MKFREGCRICDMEKVCSINVHVQFLCRLELEYELEFQIAWLPILFHLATFTSQATDGFRYSVGSLWTVYRVEQSG